MDIIHTHTNQLITPEDYERLCAVYDRSEERVSCLLEILAHNREVYQKLLQQSKRVEPFIDFNLAPVKATEKEQAVIKEERVNKTGTRFERAFYALTECPI